LSVRAVIVNDENIHHLPPTTASDELEIVKRRETNAERRLLQARRGSLTHGPAAELALALFQPPAASRYLRWRSWELPRRGLRSVAARMLPSIPSPAFPVETRLRIRFRDHRLFLACAVFQIRGRRINRL